MNRKPKDPDAVQAYEDLLDRLVYVASEISSRLRSTGENYLGVLRCFLPRQIGHVEAIRALKDRLDCWLVARSMIEVMIVVRWMSNKPERANNYFPFIWIEIWRKHEDMKKRGVEVEEAHVQATKAKLESLGTRFHTARQLRNVSEGNKPRNDPYWKFWTEDKNIVELFEIVKQEESEVEGVEIRDRMYDRFSRFHHWTPMANGVEMLADGGYYYPQCSLDNYCAALVAGLISLFQTCKFIDLQTGNRFNTTLDSIHKDTLSTVEKYGP